MNMKIICKRCKYTWDTKSDHILVSCPSCGVKNKIREISVVAEATKKVEDLDEAEQAFIENYGEDQNPILLQKAVDQFGNEKVKELLHRFDKKK